MTTVPGGLGFLIVEGVGTSQAPVGTAYDVVIWLETTCPPGWAAVPGYHSWMADDAYVTRERLWEQADLIVNGGDSIPDDPDARVVLAR